MVGDYANYELEQRAYANYELEQRAMSEAKEARRADELIRAERQAQAKEEDPWKHRSAGMSCATCMWYVDKAPQATRGELVRRVGRCRRHAPTMSGYPVVFGSDWCGDHKLDENKA